VLQVVTVAQVVAVADQAVPVAADQALLKDNFYSNTI